jgi:hypothetical protein
VPNEEVIGRWVDALRSGEYSQGKGALCEFNKSNYSYCCLGVLCELAKQDGIVVKKEILYCNGYSEGYASYNGSSGTLPQDVITWAGLPSGNPITWAGFLTNLNDYGMSFTEIADVIEEEFLNVEEQVDE